MVTSGGNLGQTYPTVSAERGAQCSAFHHNIISIAAAAATIQGQCNRWMTRWREGRKHFVQSSGQRIGIFRIWIRLQTFLPVHHFLVVLFKAVGGSSSRSSINIQVLVRYITHSLASWMDGPTRAMRRREGAGWEKELEVTMAAAKCNFIIETCGDGIVNGSQQSSSAVAAQCVMRERERGTAFK